MRLAAIGTTIDRARNRHAETSFFNVYSRAGAAPRVERQENPPAPPLRRDPRSVLRPDGASTMRSTMMDTPLSLNHLLDRAGTIFAGNTIVSRLPDKSLRRHTYGDYHRRTRALAAALQKLGLAKGERVATLCWNHHAHLEAYFGIPAAGGVMHTLNLRLSPAELGWIAADAQDRFLIVDDVLLPLYRQFAGLHRFEQVIVFPF